MRKSIVNLGRTPLIRRIIAAFLLLGTAIGTALLRGDGFQRSIDLIVHIAAAIVALGFLHLRWRSRERINLSPEKARDIFS